MLVMYNEDNFINRIIHLYPTHFKDNEGGQQEQMRLGEKYMT